MRKIVEKSDLLEESAESEETVVVLMNHTVELVSGLTLT